MHAAQGTRRAASRRGEAAGLGSATAMGMRRFVKQTIEMWRDGFDSRRVLMAQVRVTQDQTLVAITTMRHQRNTFSECYPTCACGHAPHGWQCHHCEHQSLCVRRLVSVRSSGRSVMDTMQRRRQRLTARGKRSYRQH